MKIDGRDVRAGTLVIGVGQKGQIDLPWGLYTLVFNPSAPQNISLNSNSKEIVFDGTDNSVGIATTLVLPLSSGGSATLTFAAYSIGDGASTVRVIHYTAG